MIRDIIVRKALSYVGEQEIKGNQGFKNKSFEKKMKDVGFRNGYAWCSIFSELVWRESFLEVNSFLDDELDLLFSAGAVNTFNNFVDSTFPVDKNPEKGDLVIWQSYKNGRKKWTGHAGIVVQVSNGFIRTVEGNTNSKGGREGVEVALKKRKIDFENENGLRMLGFVKPYDHAIEIKR